MAEDTFSSSCSSPPAFPLTPPNGECSFAALPADREELLPPLVPVQLLYRPHICCKVTHTHTQIRATLTAPSLQACLTTIPSMPQSVPLFWGQNPLKIPLLCGFKRLLLSEDPELTDSGVVYQTPCGQSLCNYGDVMTFLSDTESYNILQVNPTLKISPQKRKAPQRSGNRSILDLWSAAG